jgi:hypothetical protein
VVRDGRSKMNFSLNQIAAVADDMIVVVAVAAAAVVGRHRRRADMQVSLIDSYWH